MRPSTGLLTDHYELTMLDAAIADDTAGAPATFELFGRGLPSGRGFGVVAGTARALDALEAFRFEEEALEFLARNRIVSDSALDYLAHYRFTGTIRGIPEGGLYFPFTPLVQVDGTFAECLVLETVLLSIYNFDSAVASAAARMVHAAGGRSIVEMGSRRTHEVAAIASARAAYLVGAAATSNLAAGQEYGIPTTGTVAHAFILAHSSEADAFRAQLATQGADTTYLVDTYEIERGIRTAVEIVGTEIGAIRIDSGDPHIESQRARALLDELGAQKTRIVYSGDLDEYRIADLGDSPIDAFGVGTRLVTGSGYPTCNFVYKLVSIDGRGVAKLSADKETMAHAKNPQRGFTAEGRLAVEVLGYKGPRLELPPSLKVAELVPAHEVLVQEGERIDRACLVEARSFHRSQLESLPDELLAMDTQGRTLPTLLVDDSGRASALG